MDALLLVGIVLGALIGSLFFHGEVEGLLLGAVLGWLVVDRFAIGRRLAALEQGAAVKPEQAKPAPKPDKAPGRRPPVTAPPPADIDLDWGRLDAALEPAATAPDGTAGVQSPPLTPRPPPSRAGSPRAKSRPAAHPPSQFWQKLLGANPLARIGVLLLFFGVAFLLKYLTQHYDFPLELRMAAVALGGLVLLLLGWHWRLDRRGYALVLQGGGVGILYLTVFAATRFALLPPELALGLLVAMVALSGLLALQQDALSLALFGAAGGFLAPVLVSTGGGDHVQLFSYYALLNAGILWMAWNKTWRSLNLLGFVFTFVIGMLWGHRFYRPEYLSSVEPFLILFFLCYVAIPILYAQRQIQGRQGFIDAGLVFGLPVVAFGLQYALVRRIEYAMAWSALSLGGFYLALTSVLWRRLGSELRLLCESFLALGVVFLTLTIPLALEARWTSAAWALEGAALVWVGLRQERPLARLAGILLQLAAGVAFLWQLKAPSGAWPLLNGACLGGGLLALAGLLSARFLEQGAAKLRSWERGLDWLPYLWGLGWWYATGYRELERFVPDGDRLNALAGLFTLSSLLATLMRDWIGWRRMAYPGLALLPMVAMVLGTAQLGMQLFYLHTQLMALVGMEDSLAFRPYHPLVGIGWMTWPPTLVALYWILHRLDSALPEKGWRPLWHAGTLWFLTWWLAWEGSWVLGQVSQGEGVWSLVAWGLVPAGLALWVFTRGRQLCDWPIGRYWRDYLFLACGPLLAYAVLWGLWANLHSPGDAWPLPYVPLVNPLDLVEGFVLLALLQWWPRARVLDEDWGRAFSPWLNRGAAVFAFVWITAIIARSVHHWQGVRYNWDSLLGSAVFQTSLSLVWSSLALVLMAWAARHRQRGLWLSGAGLLGLVILKMFFFELSNSGTLTRILSFLGVGLLLLVIGYLAPVPPRQEEEKEA